MVYFVFGVSVSKNGSGKDHMEKHKITGSHLKNKCTRIYLSSVFIPLCDGSIYVGPCFIRGLDTYEELLSIPFGFEFTFNCAFICQNGHRSVELSDAN